MGGFETAQPKAVAPQNLPADLPPAGQAASQAPDGAIYKTDNGQRFRLRHARTVAARWSPVVARKTKPAATTASASAKK